MCVLQINVSPHRATTPAASMKEAQPRLSISNGDSTLTAHSVYLHTGFGCVHRLAFSQYIKKLEVDLEVNSVCNADELRYI